MVVYGLYGFFAHAKHVELRFSLTFLGIAIVGLGSVLFHGTLLFPFQMLDEVPMVYTTLLVTYAIIENGKANKFGFWLPLTMALYSAAITYVMATNPTSEFTFFILVFETSLVFNILSTIWMVFLRPLYGYVLAKISYIRILRSYSRSHMYDGEAGYMLSTGLLAFIIGFTCWKLDNNLCHFLNEELVAMGFTNPQLHAWWHVLATLGLYVLALTVIYNRFKVLGKKPKVVYLFKFILIPVVREDKAKSE